MKPSKAKSGGSKSPPPPADALAPARGDGARSPGRPDPAAHARRPLPGGDLRSGAPAVQPCTRPGCPAPGHDGALLRPPGHHLHHVLGPHRHRRALVRAERTEPRVRMARGPGRPADPSPAAAGAASTGPRPARTAFSSGQAGGRGPRAEPAVLQKGGEPTDTGGSEGPSPSPAREARGQGRPLMRLVHPSQAVTFSECYPLKLALSTGRMWMMVVPAL